MATKAEATSTESRPSRPNSLDTGGAVLRALARSSHFREGFRQPVEPETDMQQSTIASAYEFWVKNWEAPRKMFHCITGFAVISLYISGIDVDKIVSVLFYTFVVIASLDLLRLNSPTFECAYESVVGFLMRDFEKERVNGVIWYLIGVMASLRLFPEDIACVSIIILSWSDPSASTFGRLFGRQTPSLPTPIFARRKSLAGFMAATLMGSFVGYLFWGTSIAARGERSTGLSWAPNGHATFGSLQMPDPARTGWRGFSVGFAANPPSTTLSKSPALPSLAMYIACGLIAGFTEALDLGGLDDNISIPVLSGLCIWAVLWLWGRFMAM